MFLPRGFSGIPGDQPPSGHSISECARVTDAGQGQATLQSQELGHTEGILVTSLCFDKMVEQNEGNSFLFIP